MRLPGRSVRHSRVLSVRPPTHVGEREKEQREAEARKSLRDIGHGRSVQHLACRAFACPPPSVERKLSGETSRCISGQFVS